MPCRCKRTSSQNDLIRRELERKTDTTNTQSHRHTDTHTHALADDLREDLSFLSPLEQGKPWAAYSASSNFLSSLGLGLSCAQVKHQASTLASPTTTFRFNTLHCFGCMLSSFGHPDLFSHRHRGTHTLSLHIALIGIASVGGSDGSGGGGSILRYLRVEGGKEGLRVVVRSYTHLAPFTQPNTQHVRTTCTDQHKRTTTRRPRSSRSSHQQSTSGDGAGSLVGEEGVALL